MTRKEEECFKLFFKYLEHALGEEYPIVYSRMLTQMKEDGLEEDPKIAPEILAEVIEVLEHLQEKPQSA